MLNLLINKIGVNSQQLESLIERIKIQPKTTLLSEDNVAKYIYFIEKGALRLWFNKDGKDITFQFFFEGQAVASIESFFNKTPSLFSLESIEQAEVM